MSILRKSRNKPFGNYLKLEGGVVVVISSIFYFDFLGDPVGEQGGGEAGLRGLIKLPERGRRAIK